ncbi:MAG: folate-binding protein [Bowdeniella nasicola]|nr:folate-binding protein [Bowdeniella nasicola]
MPEPAILAALHGLPDAVFTEDLLLHRGRPAHEFRDFMAGRAVVPRTDMVAIAISGADRLTWLHTLTSQHLSDLRPGVGTEALLLTFNGHVTSALALVDDGECCLAYVDAVAAEATITHLNSMRFASRVAVEPRDGLVLEVAGPGIEEPPVPLAHVWRDPWPEVAGGTTYTPPGVSPEPLERAFGLVEPQEARAFLTAHPDAVVGTLASEAARIAAWRPRFASEVDERTIPHELDWLRTAVHLDKGCYCGQETVARVVNLGRPPRRLALLDLDGSAEHLPAPGAAVTLGSRDVGHVTSAVRHPEDGPIALALLKRRTPPEADLTVDGVAAAQQVIVSPDGVSAARPENRPGAELRSGARQLRRLDPGRR